MTKHSDHRIYRNAVFPRMYCPWDGDPRFQSVIQAIREHESSLVDECRSWVLWDLAGQMTKKWSLPFIEVGVWRGGTGCLLAKRANLGSNNTTYLCDTFAGIVKAGPRDLHYNGGEHADATVDDVQELADCLKLDNVKIVQGVFPEDVWQESLGQQFALAHIDVDTYQSAKDVFEFLWPKIVPGGVVVFDDYGMYTCTGITDLVDELGFGIVLKQPIGQAIVVKA